MPRRLEFPAKILLRTTPEMLTAVDEWRKKQKNKPSRSEALRRLVERGLLAEMIDIGFILKR